MDIVKKAQELKEIDDIRSEYNEIEKLLKNQQWSDLSIRLQQLEKNIRLKLHYIIQVTQIHHKLFNKTP